VVTYLPRSWTPPIVISYVPVVTPMSPAAPTVALSAVQVTAKPGAEDISVNILRMLSTPLTAGMPVG
jgi:hypothetical protein